MAHRGNPDQTAPSGKFVITNIIIVSSFIALCDLCHKETVCKSKDTPAD